VEIIYRLASLKKTQDCRLKSSGWETAEGEMGDDEAGEEEKKTVAEGGWVELAEVVAGFEHEDVWRWLIEEQAEEEDVEEEVVEAELRNLKSGLKEAKSRVTILFFLGIFILPLGL